MFDVLFEKVKEVMFSVLPITIIVIALSFTIAPLPFVQMMHFLIGAVLIILGLSIFLFGVDIGIIPLGNHIGSSISKLNKVWILAVLGLILGFFVCVAEPDLHVLANQVSIVSSDAIGKNTTLVSVSLGVAVLLVVGLLRILYNIKLNFMLTALYGIILVLSIFVSPEILAIAFDSSGATTGALSVPFFLSLAIGVSTLKRNSLESENDSFGLLSIVSAGAIIGVLIMGIIIRPNGLQGVYEEFPEISGIIAPFFEKVPEVAVEAIIALLPLFVIYFLFQITLFHFNKKHFMKITKGLIYTFIGLIMFLTGVQAGFMEVGNILGMTIASLENKSILILVGFVMGFVAVIAEPAVHVLTQQIELVTSGFIRKRMVLGALSIGVGCAVALSLLKTLIPGIELWHYLLPEYIICIVLTYFIPNLFVGIAFDTGGVSTGPMIATFILAFCQGVAHAVGRTDVLSSSFGMIALVATTPIITLQILGLIVMIKARKVKEIESLTSEEDDGADA